MKCPKCEVELYKIDIDTLEGFREGKIEMLATGEMRVYACAGCKRAILADRPTEQAVVETQPQSIIIPT